MGCHWTHRGPAWAAGAAVPGRFTPADVARLIEIDRIHGQLSGPATRKPAERAFKVFGQPDFENLAGIWVAHLYNLAAQRGLPPDTRHHLDRMRAFPRAVVHCVTS